MNVYSVFGVQREEAIREAVRVLQKGGVVAAPTDTVYGLLADAGNPEAVEKIFRIKGREEGKALPVFIKDIAMAKELAVISSEHEEFLRKAWPGKVTVILQSKGVLSASTGTAQSIGLRIPDYELIGSVLSQMDRPLTGTSANRSGRPSLADGKAVREEFQNMPFQPDLFLDGGALPESVPSTVVDYTKSEPIVVRQGTVDISKLL